VKQSPGSKRDSKGEVSPSDELIITEACALLNSEQAWAHSRENLGSICVVKTVRQDARRSGKEDARAYMD